MKRKTTKTKKTTNHNELSFLNRTMTFKTVLANTLQFNPMNPVVRTDETHGSFKALLHNIRTNGLLVPLVVASDNVIIDGNRRLKCLQTIGVKKVPVIMHNSTSHVIFDDLFVACNQDTMIINACQETERYLMGAKVKKTTYRSIKRVEEIGGRTFLRQIVNLGKSPTTYYIMLGQLRTYTDRKDTKFLKLALKWATRVGSAYRIKAAIHEQIPVPRLVNAIEKQVPLVSKWHKSFKPLKEVENLTTIPVQSVQVNGDNEVVGYTTT